MFDFCTKRLGLSEGEAFRRLTAARLVQKFPALLDAIASGHLHLSSVVLLRDSFTEENLASLIGRRSKDPAHVANAVRREVASRDDEQCAYRSPAGERSSERRFLEFDHRHPRALGGTGAVENIRLYCRAHDGYEAEKIFGRAFIEKRIHFSRNKSVAGESSSSERPIEEEEEAERTAAGSRETRTAWPRNLDRTRGGSRPVEECNGAIVLSPYRDRTPTDGLRASYAREATTRFPSPEGTKVDRVVSTECSPFAALFMVALARANSTIEFGPPAATTSAWRKLMFVLSTRKRLCSLAIVAFSLAACAADADPSGDEGATPSEVSSPLPLVPLGAFAEANASFAGLGGVGIGTIGATGATGTTSVGSTLGGGTTVGVGPTGFSTNFGTGPIGFNSGPITTSGGFNSGPISMSTGGTTSISSGSGGVPVITTTCTGFGCP